MFIRRDDFIHKSHLFFLLKVPSENNWKQPPRVRYLLFVDAGQ